MPSVVATLPQGSSTARDAALAELVEGDLARLQAGEAIDPGVFAAEHPEHAERLARLLPAPELMDDLRAHVHPPGGRPLADARADGDARHRARPAGRLPDHPRGGPRGDGHRLRGLADPARSAGRPEDPPTRRRDGPPGPPAVPARGEGAGLAARPAIVSVHAVGIDGIPYYAMEYVEGGSLADLIAELRRDWPGRASLRATRTERVRRILTLGLAMSWPPDCHRTIRPRRSAPLGSPPAAGLPVRRPTCPRPPAPGSSGHSIRASRAYIRTVARLGIQAAEATGMPTIKGSSIATSSPPTCCSTDGGPLGRRLRHGRCPGTPA